MKRSYIYGWTLCVIIITVLMFMIVGRQPIDLVSEEDKKRCKIDLRSLILKAPRCANEEK